MEIMNGSNISYSKKAKEMEGHLMPDERLINNEKLMPEWDWQRNEKFGLDPRNLKPKSNKKAWWKCPLCGQAYEMTIGLRTNGSSCPSCKSIRRIQSMIAKNGSLYDKMPDLEKEWVQEKNYGLTIKEITPSSNKKYTWKCNICNHEWQASAATRLNGHGCPVCSGRVATDTDNLLIVAPHLAREWHPTKNGNLTPSDIKPYSSRIVWWKCERGHEWQASISNRYQGRNCEKCSFELKTSFPEQCIFYYLSQFFNCYSRSKIGDWEIDIYIPDYSLGIEYDGIAYHERLNLKSREFRKQSELEKSGIELVRIKEDYEKNCVDGNTIYFQVNHKYDNLQEAIQVLFKKLSLITGLNLDTKIINIERDRQDIYKSYISHIKANSFESAFPELVKYWNYNRNQNLLPSMFLKMSNKIVWWKCPVCNGEWKESVINVAKGNRCPYCSGHKVLEGYNDFLTLHPSLAQEWNYDKNYNLLPSDVTAGSNKKVWWKCINRHEWRATVARRVKNPECPYCTGKAKRIPLKEEQWLKKYEYAKQYFEKSQNLEIPATYITENGIKLGSWIRTQRVSYKNGDLTTERIELLEQIGMIWESKPGAK